MIFLIIFLFLISAKSVFASPTVEISYVPSVILAGVNFPVFFTVKNASPSAVYYYKFFGGVDSNNFAIKTAYNSKFLSYNGEWSEFPTFTAEATESAVIKGLAYLDNNSPQNSYNLKVKIALVSDSDKGVTSPAVSIDVITPTPIPTITSVPTNTPTLTPTSTLPPTPTSTIKPTNTPTPDLNLYTTSDQATVSAILEPSEETVAPTEEVPTLAPTPTTGAVLGDNTSPKKNFLPLIFICSGGLFLLTPLAASKIKPKK